MTELHAATTHAATTRSAVLRRDRDRVRAGRDSRGGRPTGPVGAATAAVVLAGLVTTTLVSGSPWPSALAAAAAVLVSAARRLGWSAASGTAVLIALVPAVLVLRLGPVLHVPLQGLALGLWWAVAAAGLVDLVTGRWPRRPQGTVVRAVAVAVPVLVGLVSLALTAAAPTVAAVAWATRRDSANNVMFARFVLEDGGVDPSRHPNPAYLLQGLVALGVRPGASLQDLFWSYEAVWLGGTVLAAATAAAVVASSVRRPVVALLGAVLAGCSTYTWFVLGLSMSYGFANVPLSLALLGAVLLVARGSRDTVMVRVAMLVVGAVLLLASWAPLAAVPTALGVVALVRAVRQAWAERAERATEQAWAARSAAPARPPQHAKATRSRLGSSPDGSGIGALLRGAPVQLAVLVVALGAAMAYLVLVVLPDLRSDGGNLTQDGGFPAMSPVLWVVVAALALVLAATRRWLRGPGASGDGGADWRTVVLVVAGSVGVLAFVVLAARAGQPLWTYYPQKLAWILAATAVPVVVAGALDVARHGVVRVLVAVVALGAVTVVVLPTQEGPDLGDQLPAVKVAAGIERGAESEARDVLRVADGDQPTIAWLYRTTAFDALLNLWSTDAVAKDSSDAVRDFAGTPEHGPEQVCRALERLGPDAVLLTRAENVPTVVSATCPTVPFTVRSDIPG